MDDPRSELESMLSSSIDAELPFALERKYVHWEYYWEIGKSRMRSDEDMAHARHTLELTKMDAPDQHAEWVLQPTPGADSDWQVASSTGALYDEPYTKSKFMQDRYKKGKERYLSRPIFAEYK